MNAGENLEVKHYYSVLYDNLSDALNKNQELELSNQELVRQSKEKQNDYLNVF